MTPINALEFAQLQQSEGSHPVPRKPGRSSIAAAWSSMTRRHRAFMASVAVIAVHLVDDSFLNPEPGTSAGDHLVSGIVPVTLLGLAAAGYPRARDGVRAIIAFVLGLFAVVVAGEGWYATANGVQSGDDYSGLPVLPAGIVLISLGSLLLWRSRRQNGSRTRRYARRAIIGVVSYALLNLVVAPFLLTYAYTHISRANVPAVELGDAAYIDVSFETSDGLTLKGWYLPSRNGAAVIAFAGRTHAQNSARFLSKEGYGVLLYDRRGEAASEGDPNAFGWDRATDVEAGIAYLKGRPEVDPDRIGGIGYSVGAEMLLEAAATSPDLKAVVAEGAGIRSYNEAIELDGLEGWAQFPMWASAALGTALFSGTTPPAGLKDLVRDIAPRPVLFIHAERGQGGEELTEEYFEAAEGPKELWKTDSSHVMGYEADPDKYSRRVIKFFDNALLS